MSSPEILQAVVLRDVVGPRKLAHNPREAARKGVYPALRARYGVAAFEEMVTVLAREIDRQAPVPAR
ncbi:hypothetical protein [Actinomadura hallensis]|uniref:hypothetical protein n=1 Tax=Actinomadura hallensis TaxID=337895 RepID=UPI0011533129|nr:hypothetical protein [Actinomadura hallensis]